jgi:4-amino-4-deoxy-L-arabinose transferase-like glycosyltransferase
LAAAAILLGRVGQVGGRWWATALVVVGLVAWIAALVDLGRSLHGRSADDADVSSATVSATLCAAVAPLVTVPAVALIARQYVERAARPSGTDSYIGPLFPVLLWSALVVASLATVAGTWVIGPLLRRRITRVSMLRPQLFMAGVVGASFLLRVAALLRIAPARTDGGDPLYYHTQANTLANGLGFVEPLNWIASGTRIPTAVHGPGYTIYLAVFSRLGASTWFDHRMASSLIGAGSVLLAILLAKRLGGSLAAVLAGVFAAMYPNMWTIDGVLFPEGLFIFCCGLTMVFAYRWRDHHRVSDAIGLGAAIGAAALTRGEGIFLTVLLAAPLMLLARTLTRRVRFTALAWVFVATLAVVAPWTLRNMVVFEKFVPLSTNGNELHVYSNCTDTYEGKFLGFWLFDCQQRLRDPDGDGVVNFEPPGDEAEKAAYWQEVGFTHARENIEQLPKVLAARVGRQWDLFRPFQNASFAAIEGRSPDWARVALGCYYALAAASVVGVRRLRRSGAMLLPLGAQFAAVTITAAFAYGTTRFRAPAELALCVLAAVGASPLARRGLRFLGGALSRTVALPEEAQPLDPPATSLRTRLRPWWPAVVVTAFGGLATRGLYLAPGAPMEEGFMLVFPERILQGDVANVDFLHLYGPGSLHLLAGVYQLFGVSVGVERTVGLLFNIAIIAALMRLARPWGRVISAVAGCVGVLVVLTPIGLTALAWHMAIACALWSVVVALSNWRRRAFVAALLAALALTMRPDLVVALALTHGVILLLDRLRTTTSAHAPDRGRLRRAAPVVAGLGVGSLSMIVHLVQAGPSAVWRGVFTEPVFDLRGGRTLPQPPSWSRLDGALQVIGEKPPPWWPLPSLSAPQQLFTWFFLLPLLGFGGLFLAVRWWRRSGALRHRSLVATATLSVGLLTQAIQRPDSTHLLWGSVVALPMAACWVAEWWSQRPGGGTVVGRWTAALAPLLVLALVLPFYTFRTYTMHVRQSLGPNLGGLYAGLPVQRDDRLYRLGDVAAWDASQRIVDDLDAQLTPGERLLVGPMDLRQTAYSDVFFYFLFPELDPATRYIEMDPGLANAPGSSLADDVKSADWLILTRFWAGWIEPNTSVEFGPDDANVAVEENFCLVSSYQNDLARLYRRCEGGGAPGPYEGPYDPAFDYAVDVKVPVPPRSDGTYPPGSPAAP